MDDLTFIKDSFGKMNGFLTFIIVLTIIGSYLAVKFKTDLVELVNRKKDKRKIKNLIHHNVFLVCDKTLKNVEELKFSTFDNYDKVKTDALKRLIYLKIKVVKKRFKELLSNERLHEMPEGELKLLIAGTLSSLVNEYNNEAIRVMSDDMNIQLADAKFLVEKYEKFRLYIVKAFEKELAVIVMDNNYPNNFDKINTILYTVSISISIIPRDVVDVFNDVNGRFKKYNKKAIRLQG